MIELEFERRAVDVPADLRLYRRLAMLVISIFECCPRGIATFRQLHFLNSLYIDEKFRKFYIDFKSKNQFLKILSPSADPYLNRCIGYAIGSSLIEQKLVQSGFRLVLTKGGHDFLNELKNNNLVSDIFLVSKSIGKIPETEIKKALRME